MEPCKMKSEVERQTLKEKKSVVDVDISSEKVAEYSSYKYIGKSESLNSSVSCYNELVCNFNDISPIGNFVNGVSDTNSLNFSESIVCCGVRKNERFFKGCKWSLDDIGNRILTCDGGNKLTVYHSFLNRVDYRQSQISDDTYELSNIGNIYDYDWYSAVSPSEYYVITASSLGPLHIFDMLSRRSISSYQMYNTNDEIINAYSVACSPDGSCIIGGTANYIFLFDINRPGRTYERISTRPHFRRGIISTIAVHPLRYSLFAVGSYNNRIGIYDSKQLLCLLFGHIKGVTHLKFSPDGLLLYSGTRGNKDIICWDLRNPGTALYKLERIVKTQQRIYFDLTPDGRHIFSGCTNGDVYIWNSTKPPDGDVLKPVHVLKAHSDCANGVSIHRKKPFFATVSGQYHYNELSVFEDSDNEINERDVCTYVPEENSLKLWHVSF